MAATADTLDVRSEFPVLERDGLVYLDSGATAQKPRVVIEAMDDFLRHHNASVHRGVYPLAVESTDRFEEARAAAAAWLNAPARGTIFTKNATEAINLVAYAWGLDNVGAGDTIVVTEMEHHSNVVSWQLLAQRVGATLEYVPIDGEGRLQLDVLDELLAREPKLVAVAHASNVLGTINPVAEIVARARAAGAVTLIDGAQAVPAMPVDVGAIDADFYAWTAHKAYGPTGLGILHGRPELLEAMSPFIGGGHMISSVGEQTSTWAEIPAKFEAGTSPIAEAVGMGAAVAVAAGASAWSASARTSSSSSSTRWSAWPRSQGSPSTDRATRATAARSSPSRSTTPTPTTSPRSSPAAACACAPATTAPSR